MKKTALFLIIIGLLISCKSQQLNVEDKAPKTELKDNYIQYFTLIEDASQLYKTKEYEKSAFKYEEAFKAINGKADKTDRYNASCSFALTNNIDKAFYHLFILADKDEYSSLKHITNDTDLESLHNDVRWKKLLSLVEKNKIEIEKNFDMKLVAELDTIYQNDQNCRTKFGKAIDDFGFDSDEVRKIQKECRTLDAINQTKVSRILDENGWLSPEKVGKKGGLTLFLVLQHSDSNIKMQLKYLPMLKKAVKEGKANPMHLAMLEDRTRVNQGKKQIYGSQMDKDEETGEYFVAPLIDPDNVDKRRAEVGLSPLADYVRDWNIKWDVEKHKKRIAKMEKK